MTQLKSLNKFLLESYLGLSVILLILCSVFFKVSLNFESKAVFLALGVFGFVFFFSLLFYFLFNRTVFAKRNLTRLFSHLFLATASILTFIMPSIDSKVVGKGYISQKGDDILLISQELSRTTSRIFGIEKEVFGFALIVSILLSFSINIFIISLRRNRKSYHLLRTKVFPGKYSKKNSIVFVFFLVSITSICLSLLLNRLPGLVNFIVLLIFITVSICVLATNPITLREDTRLDIYLAELNKEKPNNEKLMAMRERFKKRWIDSYVLALDTEIVMFLCRLFLSMKVKGKTNIVSNHLPCIFVANHGGEIGPVCGVCYTPVVFRPFVYHSMCDVDLCASRIFNNTIKYRFKNINENFGKKCAYFMAFHLTRWINSFEPIHSFALENNPRKSMQSMHDCVDSLVSGDSILIFPEDLSKSGGHYLKAETGPLISGFSHIGKLLYQKMEEVLYFYPVYINKKKRTISIGKPVIFNPQGNIAEEKKRIADELCTRMNEFA